MCRVSSGPTGPRYPYASGADWSAGAGPAPAALATPAVPTPPRADSFPASAPAPALTPAPGRLTPGCLCPAPYPAPRLAVRERPRRWPRALVPASPRLPPVGGIPAEMYREGALATARSQPTRRSGRASRTPDGQSLGRGHPHVNRSFQLLETPRALGLPRLDWPRQAGSEVYSESIGPARHGRPCSDHGVPGLRDHCGTGQNPFQRSPEPRALFAMTSLWHECTGPDTRAASANLPLAPCDFARHANIARVCPHCPGGHARHEHPGTGLRDDGPARGHLGVMSYFSKFCQFRRS
jgi:hypothetical protein